MRRLLQLTGLTLALALIGGACGDEVEPTPIDQAGPGDVTDAGVEGAFGEADDCTQLVEQAVASYQRVLEGLGDAARTDVERIDAAMDSFGGAGPDLQVRFEALDCGQEGFDAAVCTAAADLVPAGPAAEDFLAGVATLCDEG